MDEWAREPQARAARRPLKIKFLNARVGGRDDGGRKARCRMCKTGLMLTDESAGEVFCQRCGCVGVDRLADEGNPAYEEGTAAITSRSMSTLRRHDMGLSTIMGKANLDVNGSAMSHGQRLSIKRMRRLDGWATVSKSRNHARAFMEMDMLRQALGLGPETVERAAYIYRKAREKKRYGNMSALVAAAVYAACREMNLQRTLDDVGDASGVTVLRVARCYRRICMDVGLNPPMTKPSSCVSRIVAAAGLPERTRVGAIAVLGTAEGMGIGIGRNPRVMAACVLYLLSVVNNDGKTQREIAAAANVTEMSIRNVAKVCRQMPGL